MFEDEPTALTPRSASAFERELRALLDSALTRTVVREPSEDVGHHGRGGARSRAPQSETASDPSVETAADPGAGIAGSAADRGVGISPDLGPGLVADFAFSTDSAPHLDATSSAGSDPGVRADDRPDAAADPPVGEAAADTAADPRSDPDADASADPDSHPDPGTDVETDLLPGARVWDAQFAAGAGFLAEARAAQVVIGQEEARRARALAGFAGSRPVVLDRPDGEVGAAAAESRAGRPAVLAGVGEWAADEVAVALGLTGAAASRLLAESLRLAQALPGTLTALEAGRIGWRHVQVMTELVAPLPEQLRTEAEQRLLERVEGKTPVQLRVAARRVVARLDAEAVRRRVAAAVRERRVSLYPGEDGMASLSTVLPLPVARAVYDALEQYGDAAGGDGDERTGAQRMADCLVDLVLRPGEHGLGSVQARLTLVATVRTMLGGDEPGELDGDLIPAAMVRELAAALGLMPSSPTTPTPGNAPAPGAGEPAEHAVPGEPDEEGVGVAGEDGEPISLPARLQAEAEGSTSSSADGGSAGRRGLAEVLSIQSLAGTALEQRPQIALADELTGSLVALTDTAGLRRAVRTGTGLGPPPAAPGYRPTEALDRYVRHRDRRCRFPGCRARSTRCDLDHTTPHPWGRTSADNMCCLCRHHHRLSHQAPGWSLRGLPDGGLRWTTPTGQVLTTHPPGYGTDDDLPPEAGRSGTASTRPPGDQPPRTTTPHGHRPATDADRAEGDQPADDGTADDEPPPF